MRGVINIGSHYGEQYNDWKRQGAKNILMIEPIAKSFEELQDLFGNNPDVQLRKVALSSFIGVGMMYNDDKHLSFSASLLKPTGHYEDYPSVEFVKHEMVEVTTLDLLDYDRTLYDYMYITAQGSELTILQNGIKSLKHVTKLKSQTYTKALYEGCPLQEEFTDFLYDQGFHLVEIESSGLSWNYSTYMR